MIDLSNNIKKILENTMTTAISHLPKTGGSTLTTAIRLDINKKYNLLQILHPEACVCLSYFNCNHKRIYNFKNNYSQESIIKFGHSSYFWNLEFLEYLNITYPIQHFFIFRPIRNRLVSMVTDYVTQIHSLDNKSLDKFNLLKGDQKFRALNYALDSRHYLSLDETFLLQHFLSTFATHGSGGIFFIKDYINSDVSLLKNLLKSKQLLPIETKNLDVEIPKIFGIENFSKRRVSDEKSKNIVQKDLDKCTEILDSLAQLDEPFESVVRNCLN